MKKEEINQQLNEIRIMASLKHENIVRFKECFYEPNKFIYIIMEYLENGDLFQ